MIHSLFPRSLKYPLRYREKWHTISYHFVNPVSRQYFDFIHPNNIFFIQLTAGLNINYRLFDNVSE